MPLKSKSLPAPVGAFAKREIKALLLKREEGRQDQAGRGKNRLSCQG